MKKLTFFTVPLLLLSGLNAQNINFEHGTWAEIKARAKAEKKLIFVDAYTSWCGPCKAMAKNTFTNDTVANYYNSNFVNAKIDMEKGEGIDLAKQYNVSCYPNLLYIDGDGNLVHRSAGYMNVPDFMALAKTAQSPERTFSAMQRKYESGNIDPAFVSGYLKTLSESCLSANDAAIKYFKGVKESDILLPGNWKILYNYIEDVNAAPVTYMIKNRPAFVAKYGADSVNSKIFNLYMDAGMANIYQKKANPEAMASLKKEIKAMEFSRAEELNLSIDLAYYSVKEDWNGYYKAGKVLIEKYKKDDPGFVNNISWKLFEKSKDKVALADAESWAKHASAIAPDPALLDTYANLLFKNGKKQEAIATEKKAIEMAAKDKQDTKEFEETLKGFEGLK